ncbi:hypothetical protein M2387_000367 [Klebsiella sp. BIGb0407]|nr:hypothetical protein [Klebsiella sp. BIGb0407]
MSYCTRHKSNALLAANNSEKALFHTLVSAELETHSINAEAYIRDLKANFTTGKKLSSATLLRRKLKGRLVRELQEI